MTDLFMTRVKTTKLKYNKTHFTTWTPVGVLVPNLATCQKTTTLNTKHWCTRLLRTITLP